MMRARNRIFLLGRGDHGQQDGIPANRPGVEAGMAQTALYVACNFLQLGLAPLARTLYRQRPFLRLCTL